MNGDLLDTNVVSERLRPAPDPAVARWLQSANKQTQHTSVIVIGELRRGAILLAQGARRAQLESFLEQEVPQWFGSRILPVTQSVAETWASFDASRKRAGRPLSAADGLIAATAFVYDLVLVTRNVKHFEELGLTLHNPWNDFRT